MKNLFDYEKTQSATVDLPFGAFKNESAPGQQNGTDIVAEHIQDLAYPLYQVLQLAGITPDGELEDGNNKTQFIQALTNIGILRYSDKSVYNKSVFVWNIVGNDFTLYRSKKAENNAGLEDTSSWLKVLEIGSDDKINFNVETNIIADESIKTYMPPGLLSVPQNIKYELNDGTFTLKAGSILTVPYGTTDQSATYPVGATFLNNNFKVADTSFYRGKFFVMAEVQADLNYTSTWMNKDECFGVINVEGNYGGANQVSNATSGSTAPSNPINGQLWYDTANNYMKMCNTDGQQPQWQNVAFPYAVMTGDSSGLTGVIQVFNGFGYLGKAILVNKGVTTLSAEGKNADGTNKNKVFTSDEVFVIETTTATTTFLLMRGQNNDAVRFSSPHYICQSQPQVIGTYATWYNPALNYMFITNNAGASWEQSSLAPVGVLRIEDSAFRSLDDATAFVAADDNAVVHNYGNEEINGAKTFNGAMTVNSAMTVNGEVSGDMTFTKPIVSSDMFSVSQGNLTVKNLTNGGSTDAVLVINSDTNKRCGSVRFVNGSGYNDVSITASNESGDTIQAIGIRNTNGSVYAYCPTYTTYTDSSTKIVTTAHLTNRWITSKATTASSASKARPAVVVTNYVNGTSWYRVWSDGWIEQGGVVTINGADQNGTVTLLKAHANTNYSAIATLRSEFDVTRDAGVGAIPSTTNQLIIRNGVNFAVNICWRTAGY